MSCPHSLIGSPDRCSQCIGHTPIRRVQISGPSVTVDGEPVEREDKKRRDYFVRGGKRRRPRR